MPLPAPAARRAQRTVSADRSLCQLTLRVLQALRVFAFSTWAEGLAVKREYMACFAARLPVRASDPREALAPPYGRRPANQIALCGATAKFPAISLASCQAKPTPFDSYG